MLTRDCDGDYLFEGVSTRAFDVALRVHAELTARNYLATVTSVRGGAIVYAIDGGGGVAGRVVHGAEDPLEVADNIVRRLEPAG